VDSRIPASRKERKGKEAGAVESQVWVTVTMTNTHHLASRCGVWLRTAAWKPSVPIDRQAQPCRRAVQRGVKSPCRYAGRGRGLVVVRGRSPGRVRVRLTAPVRVRSGRDGRVHAMRLRRTSPRVGGCISISGCR